VPVGKPDDGQTTRSNMHGYDFKALAPMAAGCRKSAQWTRGVDRIPVVPLRAYEFTADHAGRLVRSTATKSHHYHECEWVHERCRRLIGTKQFEHDAPSPPRAAGIYAHGHGQAWPGYWGEMSMRLPDNTVPICRLGARMARWEMAACFRFVKVRQAASTARRLRRSGGTKPTGQPRRMNWTGELPDFRAEPPILKTQNHAPKPTSKAERALGKH